MAYALFCNFCKNAFPEGQVGSAKFTYQPEWGRGPEPTETMHACRDCNPFLKKKLEDLETKKALLELKVTSVPPINLEDDSNVF